MEDKHLDIIPKIESDKFIKSSVENLFQNPSESEDESDDDESSHEEVIHETSFKTYSNTLFDLDEEINSSEFNLIHNEDLDSTLKNDRFDTESYLLESLLNRDTLMASTPKIGSLLDEFTGELITIPPRIVKREHEEYISLMDRLLYDNSFPRPSEKFNSKNFDTESFSPPPIPVEDCDSRLVEIDIFLALNDSMPPGIENDEYDSKGDTLFLDELLSNDYPLIPKNESFHFDVPSSPRPPAKPSDDEIYFEPDTGLLTAKVAGDISEHYGLMPRLLPTRPTHYLVIDNLLPFSSENEDRVHLLSHRGFKASKLFFIIKAR
nr:hypothetical protein [Tanacetum cinerariifolium]